MRDTRKLTNDIGSILLVAFASSHVDVGLASWWNPCDHHYYEFVAGALGAFSKLLRTIFPHGLITMQSRHTTLRKSNICR